MTAAIVLAGGAASRLGGARKPLLQLDGESLLERTVGALRAERYSPLVGVGPDLGLIEWVREDPPLGGPAAAVIAGLDRVDTENVLVIASDLASPRRAVSALTAAVVTGDGVCLADPTGRPQPLAAIYRAEALRRGGARLPERGRDASMRQLLEGMDLSLIPTDAGTTDDIDTWDDLEKHGGTGHE